MIGRSHVELVGRAVKLWPSWTPLRLSQRTWFRWN